MPSVLDASAVLALLLREPGREAVSAALADGAVVCTINLAEVATVLIRRGVPIEDARVTIREFPVRVVDLDLELAIRAAEMEAATRRRGLSLGDRACLALAERERTPALSADRAWSSVAEAIGVVVQMIR